MSSDVCKHCTHAACLDVCPTGLAVPHRVRHRRRPARHLQRLRLLRAGLPLRRDRPAQGGRPGLQVHALLRPAQGGPDARLRAGLPDRVDPVRRARASCASVRTATGWPSCTRRASTSPGSTAATPRTASVATARSSCCSTSPRSTGCRPTRSSPPATSASIWKHVGAAAAALVAALGVASFAGEAAMSPGRAADGAASRSSSPTTAGRSSRRRPGRRPTSRSTSSWAGWPAPRRCWPRAPRSPAGPTSSASPGWSRPPGRGRRHRRAGPRPGPARAVPQHAARVQADLAAVGRVVHPGAVQRAVRGGGRLRSSPAGCRGSGGWPGVGAAALGPPLATYTAALIANTAVPAWHEAHRELPFVFAGSGASAAGGLAMVLAPVAQAGPARRMAVAGAALEIAAAELLTQRLGHGGRAVREGSVRAADEGRPRADGRWRPVRRSLLGRRSRAVSVASPERPASPGRCSPGSASSRPAWPRPATRSTPSCPSASASPPAEAATTRPRAVRRVGLTGPPRTRGTLPAA